MIIKLSDMRNGYVKLVDWLLTEGSVVPSRAGDTVERTGITLWIDDPTAIMLPIGVGRKINVRLAAVEALQLISGTADAGLIRRAAPTYDDVLLDPNNTDYASYGLRLSKQVGGIYEELRANPDSRRAVLAIWWEQDLFHDGDRPCTLTMQFLIRNGKLELHVSMRSQDVWLGVPYDVFMFTQLQLSLAAALKVDVGKYVHHVGSLHVYSTNIADASRLKFLERDTLHTIDNYPRGILATSDDDLFTEVAAYLVEGNCSEAEALANPWYAQRLLELGVAKSGTSTGNT